MGKKLSPQNWIDAGLTALSAAGFAGLAAEPLARKLGTTKGSFYWHFADVPAFHDALLGHWADQARATLTSFEHSTERADIGLRRFAHALTKPGPEAALRAWALHDATVRRKLDRIDEVRIRFVQSRLTALGVSNPDFAVALYAALCALPQTTRDPSGPVDALIDTILALS